MEAANIEIKQRKQYFSQLSFRVLHFPFLVFALITLIILSTDSHFVAVGVSVISSWSLAWFETAKTWVNASIVYREKMAAIFLLYLVLCLYIFMVTVIALWRNKPSFPIGFLPPIRIDCRNVLPSLLALVFSVFYLYSGVFSNFSWFKYLAELTGSDQAYDRNGLVGFC